MWHSENHSRITEHLLRENCVPKLFVTREKARRWIAEQYGYIKKRPDLQAQPHGWHYPKPVRVTITPNVQDQRRREQPKGTNAKEA